MKATKTTDTTFERFNTNTKDRQIVTVLSVTAIGSAVCSVEGIAADGRDVSDYVTVISMEGIPAALRKRIRG